MKTMINQKETMRIQHTIVRDLATAATIAVDMAPSYFKNDATDRLLPRRNE